MAEFKLDGSITIEDLGETGEFFAHLSDVIADKAKGLKIDSEAAEMLAKEVVVQIAEDFRGTQINVTKSPLVLIKQMSIYNDFRRGVHPKVIAQKYDITVQHVYGIYHKYQKKRLAKIQPKLL